MPQTGNGAVMLVPGACVGDRGAPTGIDVLRVLETGIRPVIDIVMLHREQGRGMIGFGLTSPPFSCFEQAAAAFRERYG